MMQHSILTLGAAAFMAAVSGLAPSEGARAADAASPPDAAPADLIASMNSADAGKLIGRPVRTASGERVGEVEAVNIGPDGKVASVIVGVGGFLGVGERDVALSWEDLKIAGDGSTVIAGVTKSRLEAMEAYRYANPRQRGTVFGGGAR